MVDLTTAGWPVSEDAWLSDHELMLTKDDRFFRYDLTTKTEQPLNALTRQVTDSDTYNPALHISPNGRSVFWDDAGTDLFMSDIQGSFLHRRHSNSLNETQWCVDGQHWAEMQIASSGKLTSLQLSFTRIIIHDADNPTLNQSFAALPAVLKHLEIIAILSPDQVVARVPDPIKSVTPIPNKPSSMGKSTDYLIRSTRRATQDISIWSLSQKRLLHHWTIPLPGLVERVIVSPEGNRVAWLIWPASQMHASNLRQVSESLWVSGLDGSGMRQIGSFRKDVPPTDVHALEKRLAKRDTSFAAIAKRSAVLTMPYQVLWLPGGHKLSFQYQGSLWTVPVD